MADVNSRSLDDINEMLHLAKLSEDDIVPTSQTLYFTDSKLFDNDYKLLELDQHLEGVLKEGQTIYIKGDDDENVVLCTDNHTYDVNGAETSNSLLFVKNLNFFENLKNNSERSFQKVTVSGIFYEYLSATLTKPHLGKLMELLNKTIYKGPEHEYEINKNDLYSFEDLNNTIQSSEKELKEMLNTINVVTIDGKIRLLDVEFHFRTLSYMLKLIDEQSWNLDEIEYEETINLLSDLVPQDILISLFNKYTKKSKTMKNRQLYSYKEAEVCRFFAQILLYGAGKFNLDEFLQAWKESVPEGMNPDEDLLHGIAVIDRKSNPNIISAFPEDNLPEDISERFEVLFRVKEKWTVPEITPYIQRLTTPKVDANALLAKYARASTVQGVKFFSAKHAK